MTLLELLRISKSNSNHRGDQQLRYPWISRIVSGNERSLPLSNFPHHWPQKHDFAKNAARFSRRENAPLKGNATRPPVMNARDGMLDEGLVLDLSPTSVRYPHYVEGHPCAFLNRDIFSLSLPLSIIDFFCRLTLQIEENRDGSP